MAWFGAVAGPSRRAEGGSSGSAEIVAALTDIVSVLRQIQDAVEDHFNDDGPVSKSDSEEELEVNQEELAELEAEGTIFDGFRTWLVETGRYQWEREVPLPGVNEEEEE